MRRNVKIVSLGGNIASVVRAFEGSIARTPEDLFDATHIILPGVGSFASLKIDMWRGAIFKATIPVLGICLGMQALGDTSEEGEGFGLGLIPGRSHRLPKMRMGWDYIPEEGYFYFCHQYEFRPEDKNDVHLLTEDGLIAGVKRGNILGVQFHPEKSQKSGERFIEGFLS